jgi:hypothetical protein
MTNPPGPVQKGQAVKRPCQPPSNHVKVKGELMKRAAGLWIDQKKAMIVVVTDKGEQAKLIMSKVEKRLRPFR